MLVKDPSKRADWNEVFSFEIHGSQMIRNSRDEPMLLKNNSLVMQTSTTVTESSGNLDLIESLQRCNTDNLADQINIVNSTYEMSPSKNHNPKIKLKSKNSIREDTKDFLPGFKSSGISSTFNPKSTMRESCGMRDSNPESLNPSSSSGYIGPSSISHSSSYLRSKSPC